jgi:hypothetical protein
MSAVGGSEVAALFRQISAREIEGVLRIHGEAPANLVANLF